MNQQPVSLQRPTTSGVDRMTNIPPQQYPGKPGMNPQQPQQGYPPQYGGTTGSYPQQQQQYNTGSTQMPTMGSQYPSQQYPPQTQQQYPTQPGMQQQQGYPPMQQQQQGGYMGSSAPMNTYGNTNMPSQQYGSQMPSAPGYSNYPSSTMPTGMQGQMPGQQFPGQMSGVVSLKKGENVSLSKIVPNLTNVSVGLGWDVRRTTGEGFDLDACVFMLRDDGHVRDSRDFIFYNNRMSSDGSIQHSGDNRTGVGEGDDEKIMLDLTRVPQEITKLVFAVSIYEADVRRQNFGMVGRAFIRVVNSLDNMEVARYDLTEEGSTFSAMLFGEVYRYGPEWKFRAIGQGFAGGFREMGRMFGVPMQ